jgi:hypothetical protein
MSMATNIDDLPGSVPDEQYLNDHPDLPQHQDIPSNVTIEVRKRDTPSSAEQEGLLSSIKTQVSEDNILMLAIFWAASVKNMDSMIKPLIGDYGDNIFIFGLVKALFLVAIYIAIKKFILPRIKL